MLNSLLRRRKQTGSAANDITDIGAESTMADERWLATVWRLTSISRAEFDATYREFFLLANRMLILIRELDSQVLGDDLEEQLMLLVVTILKVRKARIIPRIATLEDASRMSETMSFALVVACVMDPIMPVWRQSDLVVNKESVCPLVDRFEGGKLMPRKPALDRGAALLFLPAVLTPIAMRWFWKEPHVVNELMRFFDGTGKSELRQVINLARNKAGLDKNETVESASSPESCPENSGTESGDSSPPGVAPEPELEFELTSNQLIETVAEELGNDNEPKIGQIKSGVCEQGELQLNTNRNKAVKSGTDFVGWVRAKFESGELIANETDSAVHVLSDGNVFIQMPYLLNRFANEIGQRPKQVHNRIARKGSIRKRLDGRDLFYAIHPYQGIIAGVILAQQNALWNGQMPRSKFITEILTEKEQ